MFISEMEQTIFYVPVLSRMEHRIIHSMWHEYDCQVKIMVITEGGVLLDS
jgi:hypothetical protein